MISTFLGFRFLSLEHIQKPGMHGKFHKLIFRVIKTIHPISRAFLSILCVQDTTLKVLLKLVKENLPLKLESGFLVMKAKMMLRYKIGNFLAIF